MRTPEEMIGYALEIDPALLPFVADLLQDFDELGTNPDLLVEVIRGLELPEEAHVVDLGCGKGVVSIAVAKQLGLSVFGIDLHAPFVRHCEQAAAVSGVTELCTFRHANILTATDTYPEISNADVAIFAALGHVLGPLEETVGILRRFVRPGGFIVIFDDYVKDGATVEFSDYEDYTSRDLTIVRLESQGDVLIRLVEEPYEDIGETTSAQNALILVRAEALAKQHPEHRDAFLKFVQDQEREIAFLEANMMQAVWVLRRI